MSTIGIELGTETREYLWDRSGSGARFRRETLFKEADSRQAPTKELVRRVRRTLDRWQPSVVAIPGWSDKGAVAALAWCVDRGVPAVLMSESNWWDEQRTFWKEWAKRRLVRMCSAALAGGNGHVQYLGRLGMDANLVSLGYDAVDNHYFQNTTRAARKRNIELRKKYGLPEHYFLASARFIKKKNLFRLIEAYATYRGSTARGASEPWRLVLLGDGPLKQDLSTLISSLCLDDCIKLPGFKQIDELPIYYGLAEAFVHASTSEQWGLVVNEAMAARLPVLVSERCGCALELVQEGINGFKFDPYNVTRIAELLDRLASLDSAARSKMGAASEAIIQDWGAERFASGLEASVGKASSVGPKVAGVIDRVLLKAMLAV